MKRIVKKDFSISTKGLEDIDFICLANIILIYVGAFILILAKIKLGFSIDFIIETVIGAYVLSIPFIIVKKLVYMLFDYMYNIEQQSRMQFNIDVTSRKILEEIQIINSYKADEIN